MEKTGKENIPCTYCQKDALPNTDPPVCEDHLLDKRASEDEEPKTLKELEARHD